MGTKPTKEELQQALAKAKELPMTPEFIAWAVEAHTLALDFENRDSYEAHMRYNLPYCARIVLASKAEMEQIAKAYPKS